MFWLLEKASASMRQRIERLALEQLDTTAAQLPVLFLLAGKDGQDGRRPGELAEALGVNAAAITGITGRMEAAGVLRRKPAPDDGRAQQLSLTAAGKRIAERALPKVAELQAELLEGFSPDEIEAVMRFLRSVVERAPTLGERLRGGSEEAEAETAAKIEEAGEPRRTGVATKSASTPARARSRAAKPRRSTT